LIVYLTKDEDTRNAVERFVDGAADSFKAFLGWLTPEKHEKAAEVSAEAIENMEEGAKVQKSMEGEVAESSFKKRASGVEITAENTEAKHSATH
jgi:hypothetical protein